MKEKCTISHTDFENFPGVTPPNPHCIGTGPTRPSKEVQINWTPLSKMSGYAPECVYRKSLIVSPYSKVSPSPHFEPDPNSRSLCIQHLSLNSPIILSSSLTTHCPRKVDIIGIKMCVNKLAMNSNKIYDIRHDCIRMLGNLQNPSIKQC